MRHNKKKGLKLGTDASHTKAMKKSLAKALFFMALVWLASVPSFRPFFLL